MKGALISAALVALMLPAAHADECMENAEDQAAMAQCAAQAYQASDAQLNELFHEIRQRVGDDVDTRHLLRDAERAWIAFRDAECSFVSSAVGGGSAYSMVYDLCLDDLTQKRVEDLRYYLDCDEGDMSCPVPAAD